MVRVILLVCRGGGETGCAGAELSSVNWCDFETVEEAQRFAASAVESLVENAGFAPFTSNMISRGWGAGFVALEYWVVEAESGRAVGAEVLV